MGAPATQVEIILMAMALDSDGDKEIDYREFKKLRRRFKLTEPIRKAWNITKKHRLNYSPAQTEVWDCGSLMPRRFQGN